MLVSEFAGGLQSRHFQTLNPGNILNDRITDNLFDALGLLALNFSDRHKGHVFSTDDIDIAPHDTSRFARSLSGRDQRCFSAGDALS
tara:strand:- start:332 stop:592 length:261 start_codon:yes stop_codon:yes gene_type:complete